MKRKLLTLSLGLVVSLLLVATAQATSCGGVEFTLVAQQNVGFENGGSVINGNVLVTSATGSAFVGNFTTINGALYAATITLGNNVTVAECHANTINGDASQCDAIFPFDPPVACTGTFPPAPLVTPVANPCVNTALNKTFSAAGNNSATNDLPSGCYKDLRLNAGAVVRLTGPNPYFFRHVRQLSGSELKSDVPLTRRTVNVNGLYVTEANARLTDLLVNSANSIGSVFVTGNNTVLTRTTINAPFGNIHPHTGTDLLECSELVGQTLTIEPIFTLCEQSPLICVCPANTHFAFPGICDTNVMTCAEARECVRD